MNLLTERKLSRRYTF